MMLEKKVIVIIGGTTGLGLSAAHACAKAGARLILVGRNEGSAANARELLRGSAITVASDARHPDTARNAIDQALKVFGGFDGLYHVAGGSGRKDGDGPLHEVTDEGWGLTLQQNLTSLFYSNRAALQQLMTQKSPGAILNMSSVLAFSPASRHFATHSYAAAKAAIIGLTRSAASYYAPHNIRINAIAPGLVATPMSYRAQDEKKIMNYVARKQPLDGGRIGHPEDLDAAVVFLLSDDAKFLTGQVMTVDGGWCVTEAGA